MAKFGFEVLLRVRKQMLDVAQRDYAVAQKAVQDLLNEIKSLYDQIDGARGVAQSALEKAGRAQSFLGQVENFIEGTKIRIQRKRSEVREKMVVAEAKHEILMEAAKEHKTIERLKEKSKEKMRKEKIREDLRANDEISTMGYHRGVGRGRV